MKTPIIPGRVPQAYSWIHAALLFRAALKRRKKSHSSRIRRKSIIGGDDEKEGVNGESRGTDGNDPAKKVGIGDGITKSADFASKKKEQDVVIKIVRKRTPLTPEQVEWRNQKQKNRADREAVRSARMEKILTDLAGLRQVSGRERELTELRRDRVKKTFPDLEVSLEVFVAAQNATKGFALREKINSAAKAVVGALHSAEFERGLEQLEEVYTWLDRHISIKEVRHTLDTAADLQLDLFE